MVPNLSIRGLGPLGQSSGISQALEPHDAVITARPSTPKQPERGRRTSHGTFEQLGLDPYKLAIQSFNFLVLLYLLNRLAYKPVLRMFDERASRIKADLDDAKRMRDEGERDRQTYRDQLNRARDEARAVLDEAANVASRIREQAMFDAEATALAIIARARQDIARERDAALKELRGEVATIAIMAATRVLKRSLNTEDARRLIDEALAETELATKAD